jgi:hypothetical protein
MVFQPPVLFDPVPGNIGLLPARSLVLLHFTEPDGVMPSDAMGNLQDLAGEAGAAAPSSVTCWSGPGRAFSSVAGNALIAADVAGRDTLLTREVTVQAIIALTLTDNNVHTIIQRGVHDGTAGEAISYGLAVQQEAGHAGWVDIFWYWEDSAGVIHTEAVGTYQHPGDGQFVLLTATRRWEASNKVVCRYYVADQLLAEITTAHGDIAGGTTGHTTIGGKKAGGAWSQFFNGTIDELKVTGYEMSLEEIRQVWQRLTVHQPAGVEMFQGLAPPGAPWLLNPGNNIDRLVKIAGQSLGLPRAKAEELRAMWLPDGCSLATIARWEKVCGLSPRPRDSLDVRRARVVSYLSRLQGYSIPALQQAFSGPLALAPADVQILEFSNLITDGFTALSTERWRVGADGAWSIAAGELKVVVNAGSDIRWDPTRSPCYVDTPLAQSGLDPSAHGFQQFVAQVKLSTYWANLPANAIVGLRLRNSRTQNSIWFGVKNVGGVRKLGYHIFADGVLGAFVTLVTPSLDQAYWLRISTPAGASLNFSGLDFAYSTTGPTTGFTTVNVTTGIYDVEWAGVGAMCTDAATAANLQATFDDFLLYSGQGNRPFHWYAYRDPGLAGSPDMVGGELLALKMKPAHTYAGAIENKSVLCDDARDGLCDRGPMGAL